MNYMAEIKAFYDLVQVKQLSTGQIALWHALMHINNKCSWIEWFTVPNLTLELHTGLSRSGIYKARNVLKQHGVIDFKPNGTKATSYKMFSLLNSNQVRVQESNQEKTTLLNSDQDGKQDSNQDSNQDSKQDSNQSSNTLNIQDNTIQDETKNNSTTTETSEEFRLIAKIYQDAGFLVDGFTSDWIMSSLDMYGFEWVKNAIQEAANQGARNRAYVNKILSNWQKWGGMKLSTDSPPKNNENQDNTMPDYGW